MALGGSRAAISGAPIPAGMGLSSAIEIIFQSPGSLTGPGPTPKNRALFGPYWAFSEPETHEAHLSAEQTRAQAPSWLSFAHGDRRRPQGAEPSPQQRPQEAFGLNAPVLLVV